MTDALAVIIIIMIIIPGYTASWYAEFECKLINARKKITRKYEELK